MLDRSLATALVPEIRGLLHLSRPAFGRLIGVHPSAIWRWERGESMVSNAACFELTEVAFELLRRGMLPERYAPLVRDGQQHIRLVQPRRHQSTAEARQAKAELEAVLDGTRY